MNKRGKMPKAVILCGGEGKRLRPLTSVMPKPLLTLDGVSVLKNIIRLLHENGIEEAAITLGYKGEMIKEALGGSFLGVELTYYTENEPLGSAGGVKRLAAYLSEDDFIVISGDADCDFDLKNAVEYRRQVDADALILTCRKDVPPLEYGLVVSQGEKMGRVVNFVEKPSFSGACSDRLSTGMYVFKSSVLEMIPEGRYDFGYDLFSKMIGDKKSVYSYDIDGYWNDIGTLDDYYYCNMAKTGGENAIGAECQIASDSKIQSSVLSEGVMVGHGCRINGAVIGKGAVIGENVKIEKGAVVGPYSILGDGSVIAEGTVIAEGHVIKGGQIMENPLFGKMIFGEECLFLPKREEALYCFGNALGNSFENAAIGVMYEEDLGQSSFLRVFMLGASSAAVTLYDLGKGFLGLASFAGARERYDLTVFLKTVGTDICIWFFDKDGLFPGARFESLLRFAARNTVMPFKSGKSPIKIQRDISEKYMEELVYSAGHSLKERTFTLYSEGMAGKLLRDALCHLGAKEVDFGGNIIISMDLDGTFADIIYDGVFFDYDHIRAVCIKNYARKGIREVSLPYREVQALRDTAAESGLRVGLYCRTSYDKKENAVRTGAYLTPALLNAPLGVMMFLGSLISGEKSSREMMAELPPFYSRHKSIHVPRNQRKMVEKMGGVHEKEGYVIVRSMGRIRVIPENGDNVVLCAEAGSIEDAGELIRDAERYLLGKDGEENS